MCKQHAFYRSIVIRFLFIATGACMTFTLSPWGPDHLRSTPSLIWLHQLLPWWALSTGFLVYTLLCAWGELRAAICADFLGLWLYLMAFIALCATYHGHKASIWTFCAFALAIGLHYTAGRLAVIERGAARKGTRHHATATDC